MKLDLVAAQMLQFFAPFVLSTKTLSHPDNLELLDFEYAGPGYETFDLGDFFAAATMSALWQIPGL